MAQNSQHPYPSKKEKSYLAQKSGLSLPQITSWFINERRKLKKLSLQNNLPFHENRGQNVKQLNKAAPIVINGSTSVYEMEQYKYSQYQMRPNHYKLCVTTVLKENLNVNEKGKENNPNNGKIHEKPYKCIACGCFFADQDKIRLHLLDAHGISV